MDDDDDDAPSCLLLCLCMVNLVRRGKLNANEIHFQLGFKLYISQLTITTNTNFYFPGRIGP